MMDTIRPRIKEQRDKLKKFEQLEKSILYIKPDTGGWNILECIGHMNLATELYLDQIESKIHLLKEERTPYKPTFLANYITSGLGVQKDGKIKFKMKTMKVFDPSVTGSADDNSIERFENNLSRINKILDQLEGKDLRSFKVTTALGPVLKFYVGDAIRFLNAHNERHFLQLERIYNAVSGRPGIGQSSVATEMSRFPE